METPGEVDMDTVPAGTLVHEYESISGLRPHTLEDSLIFFACSMQGCDGYGTIFRERWAAVSSQLCKSDGPAPHTENRCGRSALGANCQSSGPHAVQVSLDATAVC